MKNKKLKYYNYISLYIYNIIKMDLNVVSFNDVDASLASNEPRTNKIHLRLQQLGKRKLTIIQDLDSDLDFKRICKAMRKDFSCNGNVVEDEKMGFIIQLQGDHRDLVKKWFLDHEILTSKDLDRLVIHGY